MNVEWRTWYSLKRTQGWKSWLFALVFDIAQMHHYNLTLMNGLQCIHLFVSCRKEKNPIPAFWYILTLLYVTSNAVNNTPRLNILFQVTNSFPYVFMLGFLLRVTVCKTRYRVRNEDSLCTEPIRFFSVCREISSSKHVLPLNGSTLTHARRLCCHHNGT